MSSKFEPLPVTRPSLPPLEDFYPYLEKIWESRTLTNGGPFHRELEIALAAFLGVPFICLFNNATIALLVALKTIGKQGKVVTTPYSFAATTHAIAWAGCEPIFCDVDSETFNMNPTDAARVMSDDVVALLPVHCYGTPCDVDSLAALAASYDVPIIYDAAHAFGVKLNGKSLLGYGNLSILSFHATKVFNTFEGGAIVCHDFETKGKIDRLKNFGIVDEANIPEIGINGKMSEINAAFGLLQLSRVSSDIEHRKRAHNIYSDAFQKVEGLSVPAIGEGVDRNGSYFPLIVGPAFRSSRDKLHAHLRSSGIMSRRYFWPLLSNIEPYRHAHSANSEDLPVANQLSEQVLCLPLFSDISDAEIQRVISTVLEVNG